MSYRRLNQTIADQLVTEASMSTLSADAQLALDALRSAVAEALERKRRLGQYAVIAMAERSGLKGRSWK
ncbi:MAG: hypothetical protein M3545_17070 [Acidobacteriota bacterium]|nr:hypothetical protein [Acidobacteriota bacterium]